METKKKEKRQESRVSVTNEQAALVYRGTRVIAIWSPQLRLDNFFPSLEWNQEIWVSHS